MTVDELIYSLTLAQVPEIGVSKYKLLTSKFGGAKNVFSQSVAALVSVKGISEELARNILSAKDYVEVANGQILTAENHQTRIIMCDDHEYPSRLRERRSDAPMYIFVKGELSLENRKVLAVVGTRKSTAKYIGICQTIIAELAQKHPDLVIVSGLAEGMDETAHRAALANGLDTVAVLPLPLNNIYPQRNKDLAYKISHKGMLISEFPFSSAERKENFVVRNRIIAALADAVLVVESKEKGGSLHTADYAIESGVPVGAVVGEFGEGSNQGCNMLIKQGRASLVSKSQDVERLLGYIESVSFEKVSPRGEPVVVLSSVSGKKKEKSTPQPQKVEKVYDTSSLSDGVKRVFEYILVDSGGSAFVEDMAESLGMEISELSDVLFDLEMDDFIEQKSGNQYAVK